MLSARILLGVACVWCWSGLVLAQTGRDPEAMWRQLDANRDGRLTLGEGGPGVQQMIRHLFTMANKREGDSINRQELLQLIEQHRRGVGNPGAGPTPQQNAPQNPANPPAQNAPPQNQNPASPRNPPAATPERGSAGSSGRPIAPPVRGEPNAALAQRLTGLWRGWVVDGRGENPNGGHMEMELRIEGNRMVGREVGTNRAPQGLGDGTFALAGTGNFGTLDATGTSNQHRGREYPGIFELDGDTLRWCVNNRGARPAGFETGRGNYYMILRRQRETAGASRQP